jgi:oligopeptide/dipeptide ABC transporter ATP-binding protein
MPVTRAVPILSVRDLRVHFNTRRGVGAAVDGLNFDLYRGETLGLVGESGCGKSVTALTLMGLHPRPASRIVGGEIWFDGANLVQLPPQEWRRYRGKRIAMVLQDPMTALNPVFTIKDQIAEPLRLHQGLAGRPLVEKAIQLLKLLRIPAAERRLEGYPHQLSGGMRQRVVGAIALSCGPDILIADEPTTSLDVTVQAAYLRLLKDIQQESGLSILFITHDFGVVARMCDRVAVMYAGRIVETAPTDVLLGRPAHPYTEALLNSVPDLRADVQRLASIEGAPPSIYDRRPGCPFVARCHHAIDVCRERFPDEFELGPAHRVSCWKHV